MVLSFVYLQTIVVAFCAFLRHRSHPGIAERCELFILGKEVANFYTELNDPAVQRKCFIDQSKVSNFFWFAKVIIYYPLY